ncbi:MAG: hypothetical protein JOZ78_25845 [Chroococcidiopsidaceae cyanobacterium CP_BM_ER_R8_30]|nr:hypothetical protein [Chroococcidiopsidaceae cyanobacterium CP_BM_ER_R8_30]
MNKNLREQRQKLAETHLTNIQKTLHHRLEVARAQGDENLIRQIEAEINYYK